MGRGKSLGRGRNAVYPAPPHRSRRALLTHRAPEWLLNGGRWHGYSLAESMVQSAKSKPINVELLDIMHIITEINDFLSQAD